MRTIDGAYTFSSTPDGGTHVRYDLTRLDHLGMISATLGGGYVLEHFGGRVLFTCASVSAAFSALLYGLRAYGPASRDAHLLAGEPSQP